MAILDILSYPDPRLYTVAKPVAQVDSKIKQLVEDMAETMYAAPGIGLAATQVNVHQQVIVIDISEAKDQLQVFINPVIKTKNGSQEYASTLQNSAKLELEMAKRAYREAIETGDTDAQVEAQQNMQAANIKLVQANNFRMPSLQEEKYEVQTRQEQAPAAPRSAAVPKGPAPAGARAWCCGPGGTAPAPRPRPGRHRASAARCPARASAG